MKIKEKIPYKELNFKMVQHNSDQYWESICLRHDVLRKHLNMVFDPWQLEEENFCLHIVCYYQSKMVGCLVLVPLESDLCQMKQVCIAEDFQGRGIGKYLVYEFEKIAKLNGFTRIIMHARNYAVPFYEKLGYKKYDKQYKLLGMYHWNLRKNI